MILRLSSRKRK